MKLLTILSLLWTLLFSTSSISSFRSKSKCSQFTRLNNKNNLSMSSYLTLNEIEEFAKYSNLRIIAQPKGTYLKLEAVTMNDNIVIGYLTAFIRPIPFKLLQLDTIQVKNRRQILNYKRKDYKIDGPGISFIMGTYALIWAKNNGCKQTELLAVNDSDRMSQILVRLYGSFGFKIKREVTDESTLDRLAWGAVGTLMEMVWILLIPYDAQRHNTHTLLHLYLIHLFINITPIHLCTSYIPLGYRRFL